MDCRLWAGLVVCAGAAVAGPIYSITDLSALGSAGVQAYGLSDTGTAVGTATAPVGTMLAVILDSTGLTNLVLGSGASQGMARGVNSSGQVSGTQYIDGTGYATVWNGGVAQVIAGADSNGMGINENGAMVGSLAAPSGEHAFLAQGGTLEDLGVLPGGSWTTGYAVNNAGQVAGYGNYSGDLRGFLWSPGSGYKIIGTLGGASSYVSGVNDSGQVAGHAQLPGGFLHAFLWSNGAMTDLGTLGGCASYAYGLDDSGDVVGTSWVLGSSDQHAFIYRGGVMADLNTMIDPQSGWTLNEAFAINASGQIIGSGMLNGTLHSFLLNLVPTSNATLSEGVVAPEPAAWTLALLGLGVCGGAGLRGRSRRT